MPNDEPHAKLPAPGGRHGSDPPPLTSPALEHLAGPAPWSGRETPLGPPPVYGEKTNMPLAPPPQPWGSPSPAQSWWQVGGPEHPEPDPEPEPEPPAHPSASSYLLVRLDLRASSYLWVDGLLVLRDADGHEVLRIPAPLVHEQKAETVAPKGKKPQVHLRVIATAYLGDGDMLRLFDADEGEVLSVPAGLVAKIALMPAEAGP